MLSYSASRVSPTQVYLQLISVVRRLFSKLCWRFKCSQAQLSWFPGLWLMFECGLHPFDLNIISRQYHSPALPRHIFKTTCQHVVEQHRSRIGLRQRLRRGTVGLVRSLSLRATPSSARHSPPHVDVEGRPPNQRMGSIRPFSKPFITRVDTILKPINPSGQPYRVVEDVVPTQLTESPAQAPILLSPIDSRTSAGHQANPAADHAEATPGDYLQARLHIAPSLLTTPFTTSPQDIRSPLPLDGTPQPATHASANASSVGFKQTETLRQRKPPTIPLTKTTFSERPHS
jgi:hypothetical protein